MKQCNYSLAEVLPHRPPIVLLDEITGYDESSLVASLTVRQSSMFFDVDGIPAHIGLEYMAQACGAHAGVLAREHGKPVRIGFVLGTRDYTALVPKFKLGEHLQVYVTMVFNDGQIGAFDCRIEISGKTAAKARLNVYQPDQTQLSALIAGTRP